MEKPTEIFDRDFEWSSLVRFATANGEGARLGVVSGRRRQGKTYLLRALCEATGGFYFAAQEATSAESLRALGHALAEYTGALAPFEFDDWSTAVDALLELGRERPVPVVLDEFPYLAKAAPSLPSVIQNALAPLRAERDTSRTRLLLCGSAMSFMGSLLSGTAPLRGRAGLELVVPTLGPRLAARFWGIDDPVLAIKVHAIVGGTPAYRREFSADDAPDGPDDFDAWVLRTVLNPASPLFREARYLMTEEVQQYDTALYHSVLAAIAHGNTTRGGIANYLGRKSGDLAHPLSVLEDAGLVRTEPDALRGRRTAFHITEPLLNFYHAVMRPIWSDLEHTRDPERLWKRSGRRFTTNVLGPHFEHLCRHWSRHEAGPETFGDYPSHVAAATVNDPVARTTHELDSVIFSDTEDDRQSILAIGEAKWGEVMGMNHLDRLRHIRELLTNQGRLGASQARLTCYGAAGFTAELVEHSERSSDVVLITPTHLYR